MHSDLAAALSARSVASPQCRTLFDFLAKNPTKGISQMEAMMLFRIHALPRRIKDLSEMGVRIRKDMRVDATGHRYARYFLDTPAHSFNKAA